MKGRWAVQEKKTGPALPTGRFLQHAAVRSIADHTIEPEPAGAVTESRFGRDFSQVAAHSEPIAARSELTPPCPVTTTRSPFDGACHTCPVPVQAKLRIGQPGDKYEREADRLAKQVMCTPEPKGSQKAGVSRWNKASSADLQRRAIDQAERTTVPPIVHEVLRAPGQPLDAETRAFMEPRFGHDFSQVRIHADAKAAESAYAVGALAYTVGRDLVFRAGQYLPRSPGGRRLLAHELTHVLQQSGGRDLGAADGEGSGAVTVTPVRSPLEPDISAIPERARATATQCRGRPPGGGGERATAKLQIAIGAPGDVYEHEADRIADRVLSTGGASITPWLGLAGDRWRGTTAAPDAPCQAVPGPHAPVLQRRGGGGAAGCPTAVNFNFTQPAHVPHCGGPALRAATNVAGVTWSLTPGTAAVDPGSTIAANGTITLAATQAAGDINARATAAAPAAGGCFFERPFTIRSHPVGIASTSFVGAAAAGNYGGTFDHVFDSADGNVASLQNVGVGERFTNVPNPAGATHNIVAPLHPFGGVFTLHTATLTPGANNNWFLTAAGGLGGTLDSVISGQANINVGRFVQSASNPTPPQGLPASMTLLQRLHWFCPQRPAASRWIGFVTVAHSRTLRNVGGTVEFVTAVNAVEQVDAYVGPTAVSNLTATPASTPRSAGPPAGGGAAPPARTIAIRVDTLPAVLPAGQAITWSIIGSALGCAIAQDPANDHAAILTIGTTAGTVTIQAADSTGVNRARVAVVIT